MMWEDRDEPLYEEEVLGQRVSFLWREKDGVHYIRAEWIRGKNPWDIIAVDSEHRQRHEAIEAATHGIAEKIKQVNGAG